MALFGYVWAVFGILWRGAPILQPIFKFHETLLFRYLWGIFFRFSAFRWGLGLGNHNLGERLDLGEEVIAVGHPGASPARRHRRRRHQCELKPWSKKGPECCAASSKSEPKKAFFIASDTDGELNIGLRIDRIHSRALSQ